MRKVFFRECAKEEEKKNMVLPGGRYIPNATKHTVSDPTVHLKVIETMTSATLFAEYEATQLNKGLFVLK